MAVVSLMAVGTLSMIVSSVTLEVRNREYGAATAVVRQVIESLQSVPFTEVFARFNQLADDDPDGPGTSIGGTFPPASLLGRAATSGGGSSSRPTQGGGTTSSPSGGSSSGSNGSSGDQGSHEDGVSHGGGSSNGSSSPSSGGSGGSSNSTSEEADIPMTVTIAFPTDGNGHLSETAHHPMLGNRSWDLDGDGNITGSNPATTYKLLPVLITVSWQTAAGPREISVPRILTANRESQWSSRYQ